LEQVAKKLPQMVVCHGDFHPMGSFEKKITYKKHIQLHFHLSSSRCWIQNPTKNSNRIGPEAIVLASVGSVLFDFQFNRKPRDVHPEGAPFKGCVFCWEIDVPIGVFQWCLDVPGSWYMVSTWRKNPTYEWDILGL